jgi:dTMP kinase
LNVLEGLNGLDSERAWSLREKYKDKYPREVVASLIGLRNGKADQWRREFLEKGQIEGVILSYLGDDSDKAWALREKYLDEYAFAVGTSMGGLENDKSWKLRNRLKEKAEKGEDQHVYKGLAQSLSSYMSVALKMRNS